MRVSKMNHKLQTYIEDRVSPEPTSGCWLWLLSDGSHGYPQGFDGKQVALAHRISYLAYKGEIPEKFDIDHTCRNKACVNPDHLEAVTQEENRRRQGAAVTHCTHGHELSGGNVLRKKASFKGNRSYLNGRIYRACRTCENDRRRK